MLREKSSVIKKMDFRAETIATIFNDITDLHIKSDNFNSEWQARNLNHLFYGLVYEG